MVPRPLLLSLNQIFCSHRSGGNCGCVPERQCVAARRLGQREVHAAEGDHKWWADRDLVLVPRHHPHPSSDHPGWQWNQQPFQYFCDINPIYIYSIYDPKAFLLPCYEPSLWAGKPDEELIFALIIPLTTFSCSMLLVFFINGGSCVVFKLLCTPSFNK